jgi:hypothetical protein
MRTEVLVDRSRIQSVGSSGFWALICDQAQKLALDSSACITGERDRQGGNQVRGNSVASLYSGNYSDAPKAKRTDAKAGA